MPENLPLKQEVVEGVVELAACSFDWDHHHSTIPNLELMLRNAKVEKISFPACLPLQAEDSIRAYIDMRSYHGGGPLGIDCTYRDQLAKSEKHLRSKN